MGTADAFCIRTLIIFRQKGVIKPGDYVAADNAILQAPQKATTVEGGSKQSGARVTGWKAEVFVPYDLLKPLQNVPPKPHTRWRANFYRVDYDEGKTTSWDWSRVGKSFHEFEKFGTIIFE